MQDPIHRAPSFEFAVPKPCSNGQKQAYDNMLRQNSPGEWDHEHEEFIKRPEPDQFGIVEMTRQRQKGSLRATHYAKCPTCTGRGMLKRPDSVADDAMRELGVLLEHDKVSKVELVVSPRVAGELLSHKRLHLGRLEHHWHKHVNVRVSEDIPADRVAFYAYDPAGAGVEIERSKSRTF